MDLPNAQGSRHARENQDKSGIYEIFLLVESGILEILMEEFEILGFGILNPRRRIQNPRLSWIPLHEATRRFSHPRCPAKLEFIDDFIYLGSVISNEDGCRGDINKVRPGKALGMFSIPQCVD